MPLTSRAAAVLLLVSACSTAGAADGTETGACVAGECLGDLVCAANVCVAPFDDDDVDDDDSQTGGNSGPSTLSTSTTSSGDPTETAETGPGETGFTSESTGSLTATDPTSDATTFGESSSSTSDDPSGVGFIEDPDIGAGAIECSTWDQDCPAGEKCNAYADDGGNSWNATRCVDIAAGPNGVGEACSVEVSGVSGIDDCIEGAICWGVDPKTNNGDCVAYCTGSENAPECDAGAECVITNGGVLALCLPSCDPLAQLCGADEGCYPIGGSFVCSPDASGEMGVYGDPCEFVNVCDPGLACLDGDTIPGCFAAGCCSPFCDVDAPDCPDDLDCVAAFEAGQAPPGLDDVGYCLTP